MSTTEADRHHLIEKATEALGREAAMTLAEHLPPTGWGDVATTADLVALGERIDHRLETTTARIDARFATTSAENAARFDRIDARFGVIDERFTSIDERFTGMEARFDERFNSIEARFDERFKGLDERFKGLDERFIGIDERFKGIDHQFHGLRHELIGAIHESAVTQTRVFIFAMISTLVSVAGIALAAAQLGS